MEPLISGITLFITENEPSFYSPDKSVKSLALESIKYWPFYCEENIWHLCQHPLLSDKESTIIFISNAARTCAFARQKEGIVLWDYHVVLEVDQHIWDLDSRLPFPTATSEYLRKTFNPKLDSIYLPVFRQYSKDFYINQLVSDRSHMINQTGRYIHEPPPWPPITPVSGTDLEEFISPQNSSLADTLTLEEKIQATGLAQDWAD